MKKILMAIVALMTFTASANAMSYEQARREALFLTDKMAYELNLTDDQYDAAYEINLDYLMGVTSVDDVYGTYWSRRNLDISYILFDWQWKAFCAASYFYRPLYWSAGCWHFGIYARYPHRSYYYFARPTVYVSYRGGHSWRSNGGRSYYHGHRDHYRRTVGNNGMRDRWDRGEINHGNRHDRGVGNNRTSQRFDNNRTSQRFDNNRTSQRFDNDRTSQRFDNNRTPQRLERGNGDTRNSSTRVTVKRRDNVMVNPDSRNEGNRMGERFNRPSSSERFNRPSSSERFNRPSSGERMGRPAQTPRYNRGSRNNSRSRSNIGPRNNSGAKSSHTTTLRTKTL